MIAAVQHESSALDMMRERLKELDTLRNQLSSLTSRLLDADQLNLTLKVLKQCPFVPKQFERVNSFYDKFNDIFL